MTTNHKQPTWQTQPTPAAQVLHRAMQERGWKQKDIAQATGLDVPAVSRWSRGVVNPSDNRVAEVAATLGYNPKDFGITRPSALRHAQRIQTHPGIDPETPEWALRHHAELVDRLDRIETALRTRRRGA